MLRSGKDAKAAPPVKSNRPSAKTRPVTAADKAAAAAEAAATRAAAGAAGGSGSGGGGGGAGGRRAPPQDKGKPGDRLASLASELSKRQKLNAVRAIEVAGSMHPHPNPNPNPNPSPNPHPNPNPHPHPSPNPDQAAMTEAREGEVAPMLGLLGGSP